VITFFIMTFSMMFLIFLTELPIGVAASSPLPSMRFVIAVSNSAEVLTSSTSSETTASFTSAGSLLSVAFDAAASVAADKNFGEAGPATELSPSNSSASLLSPLTASLGAGFVSAGAACAASDSKVKTRESFLAFITSLI
jgi:hypothetical protein